MQGASGGGSGASGDPASAPGGATPELMLQPACSPVARRRGENWAVPDALPQSTGITRPIRVECYFDRLVIEPEPGRTGPRTTIVIADTTEAAVDDFAAQIQRRLAGWGTAGQGMYWKPVLQLRVYPGGEMRAAELRVLLDGSGLIVAPPPESPAALSPTPSTPAPMPRAPRLRASRAS
jgi:alkanesulfonate monooxygenase SsuD/methylene tetrahydromethanopterin reductase-like flavin-dependent oxidoreductase (luciferase family)